MLLRRCAPRAAQAQFDPISGSKLSSTRKIYLVDSGAKLLAAQPWAAAVLLVAGLAIVAIVVSGLTFADSRRAVPSANSSMGPLPSGRASAGSGRFGSKFNSSGLVQMTVSFASTTSRVLAAPSLAN